MTAAERAALAELAARWLSLWSSSGSLEDFDALHDPAFVDHAAGDRGTDRAAFKAGIVSLLAAFPDLETRLDDVVIDEAGSRLAVRWSAVGTFSRGYLGCEPTGRRIAFRGIELVVVRDGRVTERWGEWDGLDLLAQLRSNR